MRVLMVIRSLEVGGAERQCLKLAGELAARGHQVMLCTLGSRGVRDGEIVAAGIEHRPLGHHGPASSIRTGLRLRALMKESNPDVVYSFMPVSNVLCAISAPAVLRRRLVWGIRAAGLAAGSKGMTSRGRLALHLERLLSRVPARIISNSESGARDHIKRGFDSRKFRVAENIIDTGTFEFDAGLRASRRAVMQVGAGTRVVCIVARLDPIKGYELFVNAAIAVLQSRRDVVFWSIGGGDRAIQGALEARVSALGLQAYFKWLGEQKQAAEVAELLMAGDLGVSASWSEGFPNAVAEYASCGLRVVATDVGDTRRIVADHGTTVPAGDCAALAAAIRSELALPHAREAVRADFVARFHPRILMDRHEALLREVASGASA